MPSSLHPASSVGYNLSSLAHMGGEEEVGGFPSQDFGSEDGT